MAHAERHFVRCVDCLSVGAIETAPDHEMKCGVCGGQIENLGRVRGDRLAHIGHRCPCDDRCTSARGPICNCSCGGKNHGTNRVVRVVVDSGPVPVIHMPDEAKARARAAEFRDALAQASAAISGIRGRYRSGEFLPRPEYDRMRRFSSEMAEANRARTHASRMKRLKALIGS